jgi:hypothetical protein
MVYSEVMKIWDANGSGQLSKKQVEILEQKEVPIKLN